MFAKRTLQRWSQTKTKQGAKIKPNKEQKPNMSKSSKVWLHLFKGGNNYLSIFYIMTDNSDNLQGRNDQIIAQIKTLQTTEMKLYDSLESRSLTTDQQKQIIERIDQLSQMRRDLYASLKDMYSYYQEDVSDSRNTMNQQMVSVDVIENELNDSKRRLNLLEAQKNNKIRLVEINTFYGKQYDAHKQIMQIVVIVCIPVLILSVLANKGIIPPKLNALIIGIIIVAHAYFFWKRYFYFIIQFLL